MTKKDHGFRLIDGQGQTSSGSGSSTMHMLRVVTERPAEPAVQLGLLGLGSIRRCLISVGLDGVDRDDLVEVLHKEGVRHVVDIRLSPTFRTEVGRVFQQAISTNLVSYTHVPSLSGPLPNKEEPDWEVRSRHIEQLMSAREALRTVLERIDDGPVMILSWSPSHRSSDRDLLVSALRKVEKKDFTLVVAGSDE